MISVALCTYNGEKYLKEQLESILQQTQGVDELVVFDDASTDTTPQILEEFKAQAPFPVHIYLNKSNKGAIKNFEECLKQCKGTYIFLCDQDDVWVKNKVEIQIAYLEANPQKMGVFSNAELINKDSKKLGETSFERIQFTQEIQTKFNQAGGAFDILLRGYLVTGAAFLIRNEVVQRALPIPHLYPELIHDGWIGLYLSLFDELGFISDCLIHYRTHENQQVGLVGKGEKIRLIDRLTRGRQARMERIETKTIQAEALYQTIKELPLVPKEKILLLERRYRHFSQRNQMPRLRILRVLPILKAWLKGDYQRNETGKYFRTILSDLLES